MRKLSLLDDRCSSLFLDSHGTSSTRYNKAKTTKNPRPVWATWSLSPFGGWFLEWHHQKHDIQLVVLSFFAVSSVSPFSFSFFDEVCSLATKKARSFFLLLLFHLGMRRDGTRGRKGRERKQRRLLLHCRVARPPFVFRSILCFWMNYLTLLYFTLRIPSMSFAFRKRSRCKFEDVLRISPTGKF